MQLLKTLSEKVKDISGLPVYLEPSKVMTDDPQLRLSFGAIESDCNSGLIVINGVATLYARGDGPDYFLSAVVKASYGVNKLVNNRFEVDAGCGAIAWCNFTSEGDGAFGYEEGEKNDFVQYLAKYKFKIEVPYKAFDI